MKKILIGLLLLLMLTVLASCGDEDAVKESPTAVSIAGKETASAEVTGSLATETPQAESEETEMSAEEEEFLKLYGSSSAVVYEDRIVILESDYTDSIDSLLKAAIFLIEKLPGEPSKYIMVVPGRITMEVEELQAAAADQVQAIKEIYLNINPEFSCIDVYYAYTQYDGDINDLYYRTDHHWTHLGAYLAAEAYFRAAGVPYITLDHYEKLEGNPFHGYMYRVVCDSSLRNVYDDLIYYQSPVGLHKAVSYKYDEETGETTSTEITLMDPSRTHKGYNLFMGAYGGEYAIIEGNPDCERSLMVFGNSSVQSLATWLADNYRRIVMVDTRYFSQGMKRIAELIEENEVDDILWVASITCGAWFNLDEE
jgi:hypothetical protein